MNSENIHLECLSDFCGNYKSPGFWADMWQRPNGQKFIALGGDWEFYAPKAPGIIEESDPRWAGFIEACNECTDAAFVAKNWK